MRRVDDVDEMDTVDEESAWAERVHRIDRLWRLCYNSALFWRNVMTYRVCLIIAGLAVAAAMTGGCARTARDTTGFALEHTTTVDMPFQDAWQLVKTVLRDQDFEIYTRDKRGIFVAHTKVSRVWRVLQPRRMQYTIELAPVSDNRTRIYIESVRQVYGVTLLTYPGWHDRKTTKDEGALTILSAIQDKAATRRA